MAEQNRTPHTRTASYEAEPGEVGRVLLLYSGGLDTSVMLKWIQDEYEAEVVASPSTSASRARTTTSSRARRCSSARSTATSSTRARSSPTTTSLPGDQGQRRSTAAATRSSPRSAGR